MVPKWLFGIRSHVPAKVALPLGLIPIAIALVLWTLLTWGAPEDRVINISILGSPYEVFSTVPALIRERGLLENTGISLRRIGEGYLLAVVIMLPMGILMGSFGSMRALFTPVTTASGYIPIATLVPLTMAWFGTGETQKVTFLAMAFGIYLLPMVIEAVIAVPDVYLRTAYTLGASRIAVVWRVLVPIALPSIWQGMRLAFGVGWTYLVLTEVVVMDNGLGYLIAFSQRRGPREHVYLVIMLITLIAWIADLGWAQLGKLLFPYRSAR